jgi:hypothetical protein
MKKIYSIGLILILIIGGIQAVALTNNEKICTENYTISLSEPIIKNINEFTEIKLNNVESYLINSGQPILPKIVKTFELPFGAKDIKVDFKPGLTNEYNVDKQIKPASRIETFNGKEATFINYEENIFESDDLFPSNWFIYQVKSGKNHLNEHVTFLSIHIYPVRYKPLSGKILSMKNAEINFEYIEPKNNPFTQNTEYDLVIISPSTFSSDLQTLIDHKNTVGMQTYLKTTEDIYNQYTGADKPEQIKYFIKDAIETQGIQYVLLIGGLKSMFFGTSRDDVNQGTKDWYLPVRYTNLFAGYGDDPGYISDLYYSDIYKLGGEFDNWDSNDNGVFAEWDGLTKDDLDLLPDVDVGRLAVRNKQELNTMIRKITDYESGPSDPSWFKKMVVVAGDAFQDQIDLDIEWDVSELPDGTYTIHAQSNNDEGVFGGIDTVTVTLDKLVESDITFTEDDHLKTDTYPFEPVAEITSPSENNIIGNTDVNFVPNEAYSGSYWARVEYIDEIMHIRGKSYDPQPYGNITDLKIWITDNNDEVVFTDFRNNTITYYEDEWSTGDLTANGRGGSSYYMSDDFENIKLWTSNGAWNEQQDVIDTFSEGAGFIHFSGHASPRTWGDQYPGIPGGRSHASVNGLTAFNPFGRPMFPISKITNQEKLPIVVACGCHNGQFNVTVMATLLRKPFMWTYGVPLPECWSWWLTRASNGGAIAVISNTGMGYGMHGVECISAGLNPWLDTEFFRMYSEENAENLGSAQSGAISNYINHFDMDDSYDGIGHVKSVQQWTLLGDPSLKIGGYS